LGLAGIIITTAGDIGNWKRFQHDLFSPAIILPVILGIFSAVAWALYSVLTKKFLETAKPNAERIGHFMILTGFMMGIVSFFFREPGYFDLIIFGELFFQVVFTTFLATLFWNLAMCRGNIIIVVSISNFLPVIATVCSSLMLRVPLTLSILAGAVLVTASTIWSNICFSRS
jgi:drug/metabolite transporter (DMT)-like permease